MMILTYKFPHKRNFKDELSKALQVATFAIQKENKSKLSSKYVSDIGLKSMISNQILRKYGRNKTIKKVSHVNLIVPGQGCKINNYILTIPCLNLSMECRIPREYNKINQIVTKKILESNNFKCTIIDDGYAAIDLLETDRFDVVLMDINMPIINGFDTTKLIRKKGINIPIIALTAFDKQEITEQALSSGMNDIIIKPFEQSKLFQVIASLIDKKNAD